MSALLYWDAATLDRAVLAQDDQLATCSPTLQQSQLSSSSKVSSWTFPAAHASAPSGIPSGTYGPSAFGAVAMLASRTTERASDPQPRLLPDIILVVARRDSGSCGALVTARVMAAARLTESASTQNQPPASRPACAIMWDVVCDPATAGRRVTGPTQFSGGWWGSRRTRSAPRGRQGRRGLAGGIDGGANVSSIQLERHVTAGVHDLPLPKPRLVEGDGLVTVALFYSCGMLLGNPAPLRSRGPRRVHASGVLPSGFLRVEIPAGASEYCEPGAVALSLVRRVRPGRARHHDGDSPSTHRSARIGECPGWYAAGHRPAATRPVPAV